MQALVVYESMYRNTHVVADRIADGLRTVMDVTVTAAHDAPTDLVISQIDLVVVGGPTHAHGLPRASTRKTAVDAAAKDASLELDPDAEGPGLREWFDGLDAVRGLRAAAFDTRVDIAALLAGRASKGIARRLRDHGFDMVDEPVSFLVDKANHLLEAEAERAEAWGVTLAELVDPSVENRAE